MPQLILHLIGDYVTQSHWMADRKIRSTWVAAIHAFIYGLPFLLIGSSAAVGVIMLSHLLVDRFRLARYVVFAKNRVLGFESATWSECQATGYTPEMPLWLSVWLLIAADNTIHLACNYLALRVLA